MANERHRRNATELYPKYVSRFIREVYSQDRVEALTSNYLLDKESYQEEWDNFQAYRESCKERARQELGLLQED